MSDKPRQRPYPGFLGLDILDSLYKNPRGLDTAQLVQELGRYPRNRYLGMLRALNRLERHGFVEREIPTQGSCHHWSITGPGVAEYIYQVDKKGRTPGVSVKDKRTLLNESQG